MLTSSATAVMTDRESQIEGERSRRLTNVLMNFQMDRETSRKTGRHTHLWEQTGRQAGGKSVRGASTNTHVQTTKWQIAGWMDGWRAEWRAVEMMDQRMDVREDRLTHQMKDEWSLMAGCTLTHWQTSTDLLYTHRCTKNVIIPSFYMQWLLANKCCWCSVTGDDVWPDQKDKSFWEALRFSWEKDLVHCGLSTWPAENMSPAQQLVSRHSVPKRRIRRECVFALTPAALCMYEHMRLCKIHLCHRVYKQAFMLVQSKTEHVWRWLEVKSGAKLNKEVYLLSLQEKKILAALWCPLDLVKHALFLHSGIPCRVLVVCALQKLDQVALSSNNGIVELEYKYLSCRKVYTAH